MKLERTNGFTLVEMILVLVLVGIVAIGAYSFLGNIGIAKVDAASRKLVSDLAYARELARHRNGFYTVSFDPALDTYQVLLYDPVTGLETPINDPLSQGVMTIDLSSYPGLEGTDLQAVDFDGTPKVRFRPDGTPENANGVSLANAGTVLLQVANTSRTVSVQPETGEVSQQ